MGRIVILDEQTANQIAAGEVVEGPASIVKEMVENAVDAGATAVQVEIRNGGIRLIRVTDNGSGIARDDVEMAFERHATSKLRKIEDLDEIVSMGFRGEALASIASVSRLEMLTRTAEDPMGTRAVLEGGNLLSVEPAGSPVGTTFLVRDLFYNTPARYKFLKKDATEAARVADVMERLALAHPGVSLQLTSNGEMTVRTPGDGDLISVIYALYGRQTAEAMVPLKHNRDGIEVTGYVGRPAIARGNRARQTFLLNGRVIRSAKLNAALDEGYRTMLMTRQYAVAVVVLQVDPARVDVNVHPAKLEVRFSDEAMVFGAVHGAVKNALLQLSTGGLAPADGFAPTGKAAPADGFAPTGKTAPADMPGQPVLPHQTTAPTQLRATIPPSGPARPGASDTAGATGTSGTAGVAETPLVTGRPGTAEAPRDPFHATHAASAEVSREAFRASHPTSADGSREHGAGIAPLPEMPRAEQQRLVPEAPSLPPQSADPSVMQPPVDPAEELGGQTPRHPVFLEMRLVGQVFESFLVLEHGEEMLLLDQHAAHERIRFEDLRWGLRHGDTPSQPFLQPVVLQLSAMEYEQALPVLPSLARIGFAIEAFGGNTLLVRAIPATFDGGLSESELSAIVIDGISDTGSRQGAVSEETLHLISCKGAIKANRALSTQEARALLERLSGLENPYHCVHGRPILLRFPRHELEKRFKRIV